MIYRLALWWDKFGTRVPFSDSPLSLTFLSEQFWGRAARASWVRKNPDARLIFRRIVARTLPSNSLRAGSVREKIKGKINGKTNGRGQECPRHTSHSVQFVEMVKFTVMRA